VAAELKTCRICGAAKALADFPPLVRKGVTYRMGKCRECYNAAQRKRASERRPPASPRPLPLDELGRKKCSHCLEMLPLGEFGPNKDTRLGVRSECRKCGREKALQWKDANWEKERDTRLRREFGITLEQYDAMLAEQGGCCAICGQPPAIVGYRASRRPGRPTRPILVVDHDHQTGKIRGLLCIHCNRGLGFFKDSPELLRFALKYMEEAEARAPHEAATCRARPSKLTDGEIAWIRSGAGGATQRQMAEKLGVHPSVVSQIVTRSRGRR
jgi:hypothetical protein